jgi:outer membrane protein OmpA-like peptidoglycan-associated protein
MLKGVPSQEDWIRALTPLKLRGHPVATSTIANQIQFDFDSAVLKPETMAILDTLGPAINSPALHDQKFRIEGHTDSVGSENANLHLSEARAEAVTNYLEQKFGVSADRLTVLGKGMSDPLDPDHPADPVNRRVQIVTLAQ